jgi:hypothetical protein
MVEPAKKLLLPVFVAENVETFEGSIFIASRRLRRQILR